VLYRAAPTFLPAGQTNQMDYLDRLRGPFGPAGLPSRAFRPVSGPVPTCQGSHGESLYVSGLSAWPWP
jgi:hypothetical protein